MVSSNSWVPVTGVSSILGCQHAAEAHDFGMKAQQRHVQSRVFARPPVVHGACYNVEPSVALTLSWVISHVPHFSHHPTIRYLVFFMATILGDVQYTPNGTVTNPCLLHVL